MEKYTYGHIRDTPDTRDFKFHEHKQMLHELHLPSAVDLRVSYKDEIPDVINQSRIGSCVANATSNALRFCLAREKKIIFQPSRLFIYYFGRVLENSVDQDAGMMVRDAMRVVSMYGTCGESNWPYKIENFKVHPNTVSMQAAKYHNTQFKYLSVNNDLYSIKNALVQGFPVIFGLVLFESYTSDIVAKTGVVPIPDPKETELGGHCQNIQGFNDATQRFIVQNSWGKEWGDHGYCYIPYDYVLQYGSDFWTVEHFV